MKKIIFILLLLPLFIFSQVKVEKKIELTYSYAELYSDTNHIATITTHTNIDVISGGYFLYWSSGSERLYHFLYPNACGYDVNRLSFTRTHIPHVYKNDSKIFVDSIGVKVNENNIIFYNKDFRKIIFHN